MNFLRKVSDFIWGFLLFLDDIRYTIWAMLPIFVIMCYVLLNPGSQAGWIFVQFGLLILQVGALMAGNREERRQREEAQRRAREVADRVFGRS